MVLETELIPFLPWLDAAWKSWLPIIATAAFAWLVIGFLFGALANGPGKAGDRIFRLLTSACADIVRISPRRVFALARLAIQEAVRRRVIAGLGVFLVILAFAIWFLDSESHDPSTLYLSFVLTSTSYLVLVMVLLLSSLSLPNDIKSHTIYTLVTKPVRPSEIILGRMLGFATVGTFLLAVMGLLSYVFVVRAVNHTHDLSQQDLLPATEANSPAGPDEREHWTGRTALARGHRHEVVIGADGQGTTDIVQGHSHAITSVGEGNQRRYVVGPSQGQFHARVPLYGKLRFIDRDGKPKTEGINVGNEWTYRSYIEGGSLASATWRYEGIRKEDFPDGLRLNMNIRVFRTHKGNIEKTVTGSYTLRNPATGVKARPEDFFAKEFSIDERTVPLELENAETGAPIKLFDDLVHDGALEIELVCLQGGQYFGMAQPDVYLLPREASFEANFVKGYIGIWFQMLLMTALGVMWSTFLSGGVAVLATLATMVMGLFVPWIRELSTGTTVGGGPFESFYRLVTQKSITVELDEGLAVSVLKGVDGAAEWMLYVVSKVLPDFASMSNAKYVADGFNIPTDLVLEQGVTTLGFVVPVFVVAFLCLKMRELAA